MRITNNFIQRNALAQLQANLKEVSQAQQKVSSGLRIQKPSDDPTGASRAMQTRGGLRALEQYKRNIDDARSKAAVEESVLSQLDGLLSRASELAVSQAGEPANAQTRKITATEVRQLLGQAVALGNTQYREEYLFGGIRADTAPFDAAQADFLTRVGGVPQTPTGAPATEIGAGRLVPANHNGADIFLNTGTLQSLKELADALDADDPAGIRTAMAGLETAFNGTQTLLGETGARINQMEVAGANLDAFEVNLTTLKSNIEEVDIEKAVTELVSRQTAFQAAMLATSKVMGLTLADYLR